MISSSRERGFQAKQEGDINEGKLIPKVPSTTSRQWSAFRNPRIVRVSRSFGGKDRHSKVCTVRGLRDRRIRLSVPTAVQLYDLQDRLGLSQPSKVIDWLLDATKYDIDKLPPLQMPQGFGQFHHQMLAPRESSASQSAFSSFLDANSSLLKDGGYHSLLSAGKEGIKIDSSVGEEDEPLMAKARYWDLDPSLRAKSKDIKADKGKWIKANEEEDNQVGIGNYSGQSSAQKLFPAANHASLPSLLNNTTGFNSYYHWDPSNLSLSQFGSHGYLPQSENPFSGNATTLPSSLALPSGSQLFFCPPVAMPSLFPAYPPYVASQSESDPRQINHLQLLSSSSQQILPNSLTVGSTMKPFQLNASPGLGDEQNHDKSQLG